MTRDQLNKEWAEAKMSVDCCAMVNVYGRSGTELAEINMAYKEAQELFRVIDNEVKEFVRGESNMPDNQQQPSKELDAQNAVNIINKLWMLLDDIDTLDDAAKDDDASFRRVCYKIQQKRWKLYNPDDVDSLYKTGKEQLTTTQQSLATAVAALNAALDDVEYINGKMSIGALSREAVLMINAALASIKE